MFSFAQTSDMTAKKAVPPSFVFVPPPRSLFKIDFMNLRFPAFLLQIGPDSDLWPLILDQVGMARP